MFGLLGRTIVRRQPTYSFKPSVCLCFNNNNLVHFAQYKQPLLQNKDHYYCTTTTNTIDINEKMSETIEPISTSTTTTEPSAPSSSSSQPPLPTNASTSEKKDKKRKIKPYHKIKAHSNPLSDHGFAFPLNPAAMDWSKHYPQHPDKRVTIADIGCGYGGLTVALSSVFPDQLILGMEIREKVAQYVDDRIKELREKNPGRYTNISVERTNAMKFLPNYFFKHQLQKIFFLFPDPHFKRSNHKRRIISQQLLAEYAYILAPGGIIYTITDVEELHIWMADHLSRHPLFSRIPDEEAKLDPCFDLIHKSSEEARKVEKNDGKKYPAIFRRLENPKDFQESSVLPKTSHRIVIAKT
eukprot:TRINITY_DN824_c0_g1_i4.p1 TRINITY_DN824_c0_g1~~TRINITY_DN824_c0_g1_i4.p1  ORF type:complete len:381 (+),score=93.36 TRINITY_DN824_c0_g1_i4:83-1144(+)